MASQSHLSNDPDIVFRRHPIAAYIVLTFALSWLGALAVAAPHLIHGKTVPKITGILMFPAMLLGPSSAGILLVRIVHGKIGLRLLLSKVLKMRFPARWYLALLIPPILIFTVLLSLGRFVSSIYVPNHF